MVSLALELVASDRRADEAGITPPSPAGTIAWLVARLAAYLADGAAASTDDDPDGGEILSRLKQIELRYILAAIDHAHPDFAGPAEIRLYQDWIAANAEGHPQLFAACFNLGVALGREGNSSGAATAYAKACALNPAFAPAAINLGLTQEHLGQRDAALQSWDNALQSNQSRTVLLNHSGRLMEQLGRLEGAEAALRTSLLTDPAQPDAVQHWMHIRQKMCRWPVLTTSMPRLPPAELLRQSGPLAALALTDDVTAQCELGAAWIERKMPAAPVRLSPLEGYRHDRIRVGYLSSDFCRHAMSYLIAELFERHDRNRFEIFGYCATIDDDSDIRRRVLAGFDHCRMIRDLTDEQAARLIREDEIDILIELNGLTAHTRLAVLRWRPAPVQATYLGFVGPVPLPELDYLFCDDFVVPPDEATAYRPTPLSIARTFQVNDSRREIGASLSRQDVGLPEDRFVLCCFSNHYKITEAMFGSWMSIMCQADKTVLWLATDNAWSQASLRERAARAGVAPGRILFVERCSPEVYMSRLGLADLFLDTFPYNAGTVASDAIRMRLPLVTLCGASFASRMAGSLLHAIGARQGIVTSPGQYVAVATMLATDERAYDRYKQHFTDAAWKTTIGDIAGFTAEFEATLTRLMDQRAECQSMPGDGATAGATASGLASGSADGEPMSLAAGADCELLDLLAEVERMTQCGKLGTGVELYEVWLRHHPADRLRHVACFNQGTLLVQMGRLEQATVAFAEAVRVAPNFLPPHINAGLAFERLGRPAEAVACWFQVVNSSFPVDGESLSQKTTALKHLARVFKDGGEIAHAEAALRRCLDIDPNQLDAIPHWIAVREMQCKWPVIEPWGRLTHRCLMAALSPLAVAIHTNDPMYQLAHAWATAERDTVRSPAPYTVGRWVPAAPGTRPPRPLRIGYVSADLRHHAIGFLTAEVFELHDRAKVEVFAYYCGRGGSDEMQTRIRQTVDHWRDIAGFDAKRTARRIVADEIDILVDLCGHTGDAPSAAFALRPAPVLVNWLGFPGSMGTSHHQYIISDSTIIPPAYEKYYSERVARLPCYQPSDRKRTVGVAPSRREAGLAEDAMVYCCFNGTQKITPPMFGCWMAILARVPDSVLWLLSCDAATDERLRQKAIGYGIAPDRLVFGARMLNAEHLARYPLADLFLDTAPYGAHTTASDSLWMGVPVVTMAGHSFPSRVCASLVTAAGLPELVCDSVSSYLGLAVELGNRPDKLLALREKLRASRKSCTLFDTPHLVGRLESIYAQMWGEYLSGEIPEPDLTNLAIYNEIGGEFDHETAAATDLPTYERSYLTALRYRHSLSPIPSDHRLWTVLSGLAGGAAEVWQGNDRTMQLPPGVSADLPGDTTARRSSSGEDQHQGYGMKSLNVVRKSSSDLVSKVDEALSAAIMKSDIDSSVGFYSIGGMSGKKYRYFINNLIRTVEKPRYLEIGSWAGSTLCSAIHGNDVDAIAIDNWSEFGGPKQAFLAHVMQYQTSDARVQFIEADFRHVNYQHLGRRNVYLYDGPHDERDQFDALNMVLDCLDHQFVFIVDDWNWIRVRSGTFSAIENCGLSILFSAEIRTTLNDVNPDVWFKDSDWHNGYFIAVLQKSDLEMASVPSG